MIEPGEFPKFPYHVAVSDTESPDVLVGRVILTLERHHVVSKMITEFEIEAWNAFESSQEYGTPVEALVEVISRWVRIDL